MKQTIVESRAVVMESVEGSASRFRVQYITPGLGSSGYYSAAVLESAASSERFPAGTPLYMDHPSMSDREDRPERSVRDMAAVATTPGVWNPETQAVEAEVELYPHYAWLGPMVKDIGLSIRASAEMSEGTVEGQKTRIIDDLVEVMSVDFVTRAGRGGKVLDAIESARVHLEEATSSDRRDQIERAAREKFGADGKYVWVRDFDENTSTAYLALSSETEEKVISQAYAVANDDLSVSLDGDPAEVRVVTNYVPVSNTIAEGESVGDENKTEVTEAQRITALETELAQEKAAHEAAKAREAKRIRTDETRTLAESKLAGLPLSMVHRVTESVLAKGDSLLTDGKVDKAKVEAAAEAAHKDELAYLQSIGGNITVTGHGSAVVESTETTRAQADEAVAFAFGRSENKKG